MKKGEISFSMLGYHMAEKFHSPSSERIQNHIDQQQLPVTIYWNPEIKLSNAEKVLSVPLDRTDKNIVILLEGTDQQGKIGFVYARMR